MNIVYIMSDDHSYQTISAYDDRFIETPNIDRIAREGARFTNSFVANSISGPSRACMLTGKHSHANGFTDNSAVFDGGQQTFPKLLQKAGYQTAVIGKWHLTSAPTGFDYSEILIGQGIYYNAPFVRNGEKIASQGYVTNVITDKAIEEWLAELREILESPEVGAVDLLDDIKINLQDKEVHVFTPAGDLKTLPAGATLLDFAYAIHTAIGSKCVGGKVNQRNETLRYVLKNGDQVSILTSNNQQPSADWLNIAVTSKARNKIRQFLTEHSRAQATMGKEMLARRFKNWKIELTDEVIHRLQQHYKYKFAIDLYQAIAEEKLDMAEIKDFITKDKEEESPVSIPREEVRVTAATSISKDVLLIDKNVNNVEYKFAHCCNPVFGDDIVGFVSIGEGIKIHRKQCKNALDLQRRYPYRIVEAQWTNEGAASYQTVLSILGREDAGMVSKISEIIAKDPKVTLRGLSINSNGGMFDGQITVLVNNTEHLAQLISQLKRIPGVMRVSRHDSVKE